MYSCGDGFHPLLRYTIMKEGTCVPSFGIWLIPDKGNKIFIVKKIIIRLEAFLSPVFKCILLPYLPKTNPPRNFMSAFHAVLKRYLCFWFLKSLNFEWF